MTTPEKFSETNILNSVATYLAPKLLADGYLLYWQDRDILQIDGTATGFYFEFNTNRATILALPEVVTALGDARGILTIMQALPAVPRFVTRLIDDTSIGVADTVYVPAISIELDAPLVLENHELGTTVKLRSRHLLIDAYVRSPTEMSYWKDRMALWFEDERHLTIADHDAGTVATVGTVDCFETNVSSVVLTAVPEAATYEVLLNTKLVYVA